MRTTFLLLFYLILASGMHAQTPVAPRPVQTFVHYQESTGMVMIESITPGTTLFALSRKYNVGIDSILAANPDLDPQAIPLGFPVHIPIDIKAITFTTPDPESVQVPVYYRVQPKETLYRISKVYLGVSPETVVALNPRAGTNISIGEVLHLGWYIPTENKRSPVTQGGLNTTDSTAFVVKDFKTEYKTEGRTIKEQKGLAVWKAGDDQTHYFVLHATAKVGTFMEVTNPMLHRTLTAKVAGNIPAGLYQQHVGLVVSPSVARALGVLDQQFFARWRFVE